MKLAFVTGSSGGIGLAIAPEPAATGYSVVVTLRSITASHSCVTLIGAEHMCRVGDSKGTARGRLNLEDSPFVTGEIPDMDRGASLGRW